MDNNIYMPYNNTLFIPRIVSTSSCSTFNFAFHKKSVRATKSPCLSNTCNTIAIKNKNKTPSIAKPIGNCSLYIHI